MRKTGQVLVQRGLKASTVSKENNHREARCEKILLPKTGIRKFKTDKLLDTGHRLCNMLHMVFFPAKDEKTVRKIKIS
jgi:hypothetical protein